MQYLLASIRQGITSPRRAPPRGSLAANESRLLASFLSEDAFVIVAHPDDDSVAMGVYLQRRQARVSFLTSGEAGVSIERLVRRGRSPYLREEEAAAAHRLVARVEIAAFERFPDKQLYKYLRSAATRLLDRVASRPPSVLMTHAFEGGHPDHDCCSFLSSRIGRKLNIPVWEFPEYSAPPHQLIQRFPYFDPGDTVVLLPSPDEVKVKRQMFRAHRSQRASLRLFDPAAPEFFRIQRDHDFFRPVWSQYFSNPRYVEDLVEAFRQFDNDF